MNTTRRQLIQLAGPALAAAAFGAKAEPVLDVRSFGTAGDGRADDTAAINHAIATAAAAGGGIIRFPAGTYRSYSIRLKNFITLYLDEGATILAANTPHDGTTSGGYDTAELNVPWDAYQDFGRSHWHNSLIWGENVRDITILGPGRIWGHGLSRGFNEPDMPLAEAPGAGNKTIALKNCRHVTLRDFSILSGGHFGILATGVDNLTIYNLTIDTNRDGIDIDCCRDAQISNSHVNAPWDDAIALKSSFALGYARTTENVTITNCSVTGGYQVGSLLDRTFKPVPAAWVAPDSAHQMRHGIKRWLQKHHHCQLLPPNLPRRGSGKRGRWRSRRHHRHRADDARYPRRTILFAARITPARPWRHCRRQLPSRIDQQC